MSELSPAGLITLGISFVLTFWSGADYGGRRMLAKLRARHRRQRARTVHLERAAWVPLLEGLELRGATEMRLRSNSERGARN